MKDYNGFPPEFRTAVYNIQKAAGLMIPIVKMPCSVCGGAGGLMMGHSENYYILEDLRPVCVECHMKLHARFSRPAVWLGHLVSVRRGEKPTQWATTNEYFASQQKTSSVMVSMVVSPPDPSTFGDEWYHQLLMKKIDLYSTGTRKIPTKP